MKNGAFSAIREFQRIISLTGVPTLFLANNALAASAIPQRQPVAGAALFIAFAIAYLSRRRAIGGWLLYFYVQLYSSFAFSLFLVSRIVSNLNPAQWDDSMLYVMFFLSVVPVIVAEGIEVFAATKLLLRRNEQNLIFLRRILIALASTTGVALAIDIAFFRDDPALFFDILMFVFALIWTLYFFKARRIRLVFVDRNWMYTPYSERRGLLPEDKKKLRKRSLIAALVTFVLFLLMMGVSLKEKQPDLSIFGVPLFYAFVAFVIAWYLPLRKKKPISSRPF